MPLELLIKAVDNVHPDPIIDRASHKKGDLIVYKFLPHPGWASKEGLPDFVIVRINDSTLTDEQVRQYHSSWDKTIDYEVLSAGPNSYQVRVFGNNVSASGENILTREQVEGYLEKWGCVVDSVAQNEVVFTLNLWDTLCSYGFWQVDLLNIIFTLVSYNSQSGNAVVNVNYSTGNWKPSKVARYIESRGGVINSHINQEVEFTINRSQILAVFKADVGQELWGIFVGRRFYFNPADVDLAIAAGGFIEVTKQQFLKRLKDKLED